MISLCVMLITLSDAASSDAGWRGGGRSLLITVIALVGLGHVFVCYAVPRRETGMADPCASMKCALARDTILTVEVHYIEYSTYIV